MHDVRGNYILSLNKPRTELLTLPRRTSHGLSSFSYVSAKLRNAPSILSVPLSLLVLKANPGPHFTSSRVKLSLWPFYGRIPAPTDTIWASFESQKRQSVLYFAGRTGSHF